MEIKQLDQILINDSIKKDSIDIPDCFGEYNKKNKLCLNYCSVCIRCCVLHNKNPKIDILEKLLIHNHYATKPH
ncbi:hypothetical protein [Desulfobacula sp.]|uniref:hypothetical protein n=1 Tax=Desulfobacula sp. TaxID=2593537 RepID=UPI00263132E5|nr:hypothetical protein [Desulfobacula sp.]